MNQTTEQQERISLDRINTAAEVRKHAENIRKAATALAGYVVSTEIRRHPDHGRAVVLPRPSEQAVPDILRVARIGDRS